MPPDRFFHRGGESRRDPYAGYISSRQQNRSNRSESPSTSEDDDQIQQSFTPEPVASSDLEYGSELEYTQVDPSNIHFDEIPESVEGDPPDYFDMLAQAIQETNSLPFLMIEMMQADPELSRGQLERAVKRAIVEFLAPMEYNDRMEALDERILAMTRQWFGIHREIRAIDANTGVGAMAVGSVRTVFRGQLQEALCHLLVAHDQMTDFHHNHKRLKETLYHFTPDAYCKRAIQGLEIELKILECEKSRFYQNYRIGSEAWFVWAQKELDDRHRELAAEIEMLQTQEPRVGLVRSNILFQEIRRTYQRLREVNNRIYQARYPAGIPQEANNELILDCHLQAMNQVLDNLKARRRGEDQMGILQEEEEEEEQNQLPEPGIYEGQRANALLQARLIEQRLHIVQQVVDQLGYQGSISSTVEQAMERLGNLMLPEEAEQYRGAIIVMAEQHAQQIALRADGQRSVGQLRLPNSTAAQRAGEELLSGNFQIHPSAPPGNVEIITSFRMEPTRSLHELGTLREALQGVGGVFEQGTLEARRGLQVLEQMGQQQRQTRQAAADEDSRLSQQMEESRRRLIEFETSFRRSQAEQLRSQAEEQRREQRRRENRTELQQIEASLAAIRPQQLSFLDHEIGSPNFARNMEAGEALVVRQNMLRRQEEEERRSGSGSSGSAGSGSG